MHGLLWKVVLRIRYTHFKITKCYGHYSNRKHFWDVMVEDNLLEDPILIMGGDLNLVVSTREVWGANPGMDPLLGYLSHIFQESKLIDVMPNPFFPT